MRWVAMTSCILLGALAGPALAVQTLEIKLQSPDGAVAFAAAEIRREAQARGMTVVNTEVSASDPATRIVLAVGDPVGSSDNAQSYRIRVDQEEGHRSIVVRGAGVVGTMYGGLDVAEAIRTGRLEALQNSDHSPHIVYRGIKFNIPLDLRTPTYTQISDAAQANIPEVWSMDFWQDFLDDMARHRYNVLSLWSLHPFPSIVKVPEFPHVALEDVWRTREPLDDSFKGNGHDFVRPNMLANHEVVKTMTIDEKIQFWRDVMQLARDRGVDLYWFTWNVFLHGAVGKDGITHERCAPRTIAYFRASVRETIKTYPLLAGFGITAGEGMPASEFKEISKEQWLWKTYGEGIRDVLGSTPDRKFRLIHRFHLTSLAEIKKEFAELPCQLDLSFKYAIAHMYSVPNPSMIKPALPLLTPELRTWLTVRNDDIYSFRWADVDFARAFVKAMPGDDKVVGFYMGCDNFLWGRDFLSKDAGTPRQTVMHKQWLSFALWGRLAYDPELPATTFERLTAARFPGADVPALSAAWADASKTFPYITRFYWGDIDVKWFPEACWSHPKWYRGFHTLRHFVEGGTMPGAGVLNIIEWRNGQLTQQMPEGVTPPEIATMLHTHAARALQALPALRRATVTPAESAKEYTATLGDIEAMAYLGLYYAAKMRGACAIALFDKTGDGRHQTEAIQHMEEAWNHWKNYASAYTRQYVQPVFYNRSAWVDIPKLTDNVTADIQMAHDWKPGTIKEDTIRRSHTEAGFQK